MGRTMMWQRQTRAGVRADAEDTAECTQCAFNTMIYAILDAEFLHDLKPGVNLQCSGQPQAGMLNLSILYNQFACRAEIISLHSAGACLSGACI
jgi:hypothetical protein